MIFFETIGVLVVLTIFGFVIAWASMKDISDIAEGFIFSYFILVFIVTILFMAFRDNPVKFGYQKINDVTNNITINVK